MKSLSARLLLLTVVFVMLAEVLIFVPSVARFRMTYLADRMEAAHLAILVMDATPDGMVSDRLTQELLSFVNAYAVASQRGDAKFSIMIDMPPPLVMTVRPSEESTIDMIVNALEALTSKGSRTIRVIGPSPRDPGVTLEILMEDGDLCHELRSFAFRIFWLSLVISLMTALMVFLVLQRQLVRPLKRLIRNMTRFRMQPEDQSRVIRPSGRQDEMGIAEREMASMQTAVREALTQRKHLAALGTAVAKINHDLRGILSSALLVSDRLESSDDPEVRRIAPGLLDAIDRAVDLCSRTLNYVSHDVPTMKLCRVPLGQVISDAGFGLPNDCTLEIIVERSFEIHADRNQVFRIFNNLFRNAAEAGSTRVQVEARIKTDCATLRISDNGPGLPPRAQQHLFQPFEGSGKAGGTGLGLSIARELARSHGGDLRLVQTSAEGTVFELTLPQEGPIE